MKLQGRKILITGASQVSGLAVAERCVAGGADVALCARSREQLGRAAAALRAKAAKDQRVTAAVADVSSPKEVEALVADATRELGGLDGLVNNAGIYGPKGAIEDVDWAEWAKAMEINLSVGDGAPRPRRAPREPQHAGAARSSTSRAAGATAPPSRA